MEEMTLSIEDYGSMILEAKNKAATKGEDLKY